MNRNDQVLLFLESIRAGVTAGILYHCSIYFREQKETLTNRTFKIYHNTYLHGITAESIANPSCHLLRLFSTCRCGLPFFVAKGRWFPSSATL